MRNVRSNNQRRIRIYGVEIEGIPSDNRLIERLAKREFQLLETFHRGLCPQSILVWRILPDKPEIKIYNWQFAHQISEKEKLSQSSVSSHLEGFRDDASTAYLAPESLNNSHLVGEYLDVFSLGAIAYHLFSGQPPGINGLEVSQKLRESKGLQLSSVINGAPQSLQSLIQYSTHPEVINRIETVKDFLSLLEEVEDELTAPEGNYAEDPTLAQKDDYLSGNFKVIRRLGQGSSSVALLVVRERQEYVLKVANSSELNDKVESEIQILQKLRHSHIVEYIESVEINHRKGFLMKPIFVDREKRRIETLGQRLRQEGQLHIDLLQRFGEDLLDIVKYLEEQGINHRDLKPDNIAIGQVGSSAKLHLILFDFSLSKTPIDNIRAGTTGYLDPLLPLRRPLMWDLQAERYSAGITLYEMATGTLPQWGDGKSDPSHLNCEITLEAELFEPNLREGLSQFFQQALRRDPQQRFDNADEMLQAWRDCFIEIDPVGSSNNQENPVNLEELLEKVTIETAINQLGLSIRAINALDRLNILSVRDLLATPKQQLNRLRGVGNRTRREIMQSVNVLQNHFETQFILKTDLSEEISDLEDNLLENSQLSVDSLFNRINRSFLREKESISLLWETGDGKEKEKIIAKFRKRWLKDANITQLRLNIIDILTKSGDVMGLKELTDAILLERGSIYDEPQRSQFTQAVLRTAIEAEKSLNQPRFLDYSQNGIILIAKCQVFSDYGRKLGQMADKLAQADPLLSPNRVIEELRKIPCVTNAENLSDSRLVRLAVVASQNAAISSRGEIYPRQMDAKRAFTLSQGALYGLKSLTIDQIQERVSSRYPEAQKLPNRPQLDRLITEIGLEFAWNPVTGRYEMPSQGWTSLSSSLTLSPLDHNWQDIPTEVINIREFENKLKNGVKNGSYLILLVKGGYYQQAYQKLCDRFEVELVDMEGLFIEKLQEVANQARVNWDLVLAADATPYRGDWDKLMILVQRTLPLIETRLQQIDKPILMIYPSLLARYDQMRFFEQLRDKIGQDDGLKGLWVLVAGEREATLEGKAIPILSAGQRSYIPDAWLSF